MPTPLRHRTLFKIQRVLPMLPLELTQATLATLSSVFVRQENWARWRSRGASATEALQPTGLRVHDSHHSYRLRKLPRLPVLPDCFKLQALRLPARPLPTRPQPRLLLIRLLLIRPPLIRRRPVRLQATLLLRKLLRLPPQSTMAGWESGTFLPTPQLQVSQSNLLGVCRGQVQLTTLLKTLHGLQT